MSVVVDCSVVLASLAKDETSAYAEAVLDHVAIHGAVAPPLFFAELANGLLIMLRRRRMSETELRQGCAAAAAMKIALPMVANLDELPGLVTIAHAHNLTAYDAAYLDLALRERLPLATLDAELATAARAAGAAIFSP